MSAFTDSLTPDHIAMIGRQAMFFVATAAAEGRINLSPKGLADTFRVLSPSRVAWLDLAGSGNETNAHLQADGRVTVESVQTSCGWGVPLMRLDSEREALVKYHAQQDPAEWTAKYSARAHSIDGLPARPTDRYIAGD
jgi:hypothetical protein